MTPDDPAVLDVVRHTMVARIATISRNGHPSVNPLYFVRVDGNIWLGTADWTLAARNVGADPRVSVLFEPERPGGHPSVVRIRGRARVRTDSDAQRVYRSRVVRRYVLTPSGIRDIVAHVRQLGLRRDYYAQSRRKGRTCVIEVTPEHAELLDDPQRPSPAG